MSIPKRIWAIWCDFNNQKDGTLTDNLNYFKNRIIQQHPDWEVNVITNWETLIGYISENEVLVNIANNPYINGAHKSDAIRFFLLYKFGGFWLDISTFLFTPLDIYYQTQPNATFIGYFTPPFMVEEIIYSVLGEMLDGVKFHEIAHQFKEAQSKYIKLNNAYQNYPYIPENFFIASTPNHPIITEVFNNLISFWSKSIPLITDDATLCFQINLLMNELAGETFEINDVNYHLTTQFAPNDITDPSFLRNRLNDVWHCGYVFNYLQLYIAIVNYIKANNLTITQETNPHPFSSNYSQDLCVIDNGIQSCENIVGTNPTDGTVLYLISLSYNRLIKWADSMQDRVSFDNTYIKSSLDEISSQSEDVKEKFLQQLIDMGIYQIKFSSWTRKSTIIDKLKELYPLQTMGGKTQKTGKTQKKRKHYRRSRKSKRNRRSRRNKY